MSYSLDESSHLDIINVRRSIIRYDAERAHDVVPLMVDTRRLHFPRKLFQTK